MIDYDKVFDVIPKSDVRAIIDEINRLFENNFIINTLVGKKMYILTKSNKVMSLESSIIKDVSLGNPLITDTNVSTFEILIYSEEAITGIEHFLINELLDGNPVKIDVYNGVIDDSNIVYVCLSKTNIFNLANSSSDFFRVL